MLQKLGADVEDGAYRLIVKPVCAARKDSFSTYSCIRSVMRKPSTISTSTTKAVKRRPSSASLVRQTGTEIFDTCILLCTSSSALGRAPDVFRADIVARQRFGQV